MFNVGDRVERIIGSFHGMNEGDVGRVSAVRPTAIDIRGYGEGFAPQNYRLVEAANHEFQLGDLVTCKMWDKYTITNNQSVCEVVKLDPFRVKCKSHLAGRSMKGDHHVNPDCFELYDGELFKKKYLLSVPTDNVHKLMYSKTAAMEGAKALSLRYVEKAYVSRIGVEYTPVEDVAEEQEEWDEA